MGPRFLLAFLSLYVLFSLLHPVADGRSLLNPCPDRRSRALLQNPETEKGRTDPPPEKELPPASAEESEHHEFELETPAEAPAEGRKIARHHSSDKSVAGGGVIIGGLVTAIFAAVYCYIRVTRRRHPETLT